MNMMSFVIAEIKSLRAVELTGLLPAEDLECFCINVSL